MTRFRVPKSFANQPRWWTDGTAWLDSLPDRVREQCRRWEMELDGEPWHGGNAVVLPVRRRDERFALRLAPPDDRTRGEIAALDFWDGRGTVRQYAADPDAGASLLELLDGSRTLMQLDLEPAAEILGQLMRDLAVPVTDPQIRSTADIATERIAQLEHEWTAADRPFERSTLDAAIAAARSLAVIDEPVAVNGDLHHDQVLAGDRQPWLVVDPILLRGDIAYDLARCLWWRLDDMADDRVITEQLRIIARSAGLDHDHARTAVIYRTVDYWLWGLRHGLTEDPVRCARLFAAVR